MQKSFHRDQSRPVFDQPLQIVRPQFPDVDDFLPAFRAALTAGQVTNNGPRVIEFESYLTEYLQTPTIVFSNGQLALMAMLRAAGIDGGEVIVPSFTFAATPHAVRWCGAEPIFADIMSDGSMRMDPDDVTRKISKQTVAIVGVDPYGIVSDYRSLEEIARNRKLRLLFDSAPSFGATYLGRPIGCYGDAQIFSFHATKAFTTMEGGCLSSRDTALLERARVIRNFGQTADGDCSEAGFNGKMSEVCALIGLQQLKTFDIAARTRRHAAARIAAGLAHLPGLQTPPSLADQDPIWLYLPVVIDKSLFGLNRDEAASALARENLMVRKYYSPPCHHMTAYGAHRHMLLPHTEAAAYNVLALPIYNDMTDWECDGIIAAFERAHSSALVASSQRPKDSSIALASSSQAQQSNQTRGM
jgi:dTDP-4-amino-4,6-dideoxygalactose transaminase